ncbi:MAG: sialate O-acetylesterase [Planctomycetota bacterium]|nr:sialate O-acetylesterase [Planctomycetota bacterium]
MRCYLILVAVLMVQLVSRQAADAEEGPDRMILLIGQSNMAGRAPLEDGDEKPIEGVLLLDGEGKWIAASNPLNRFATDRKNLSMQRIGPGFGFAGHLAEQLKDEKIGLVVNARGGSSINLWKPGETLYDHTLARLKAAGIKKVDAVIWHQGESDAQDPEYLEKLVMLVSNLRRDIGTPEMPFVAGEVFKDLPVNERMRGLPLRLKNTAVVSAGELKVFDGVHFDRESQLILGRRYAEALLKMLGKR